MHELEGVHSNSSHILYMYGLSEPRVARPFVTGRLSIMLYCSLFFVVIIVHFCVVVRCSVVSLTK